MRVTDSTKRSKRPYILGVAGGSGSGKTYFARALQKALGMDKCEIVYQDNFYIDQSHRFDRDGGAVNFDHPDSLDFPLLAECLRTLKEGQSTEIPIYDFATHKRKMETLNIPARSVIIVDGILIFHPPYLRELFDEMVFFETPEELRFERRLNRDVSERGRTPEGVKAQFEAQVKPMHDHFVEPSKAFAQSIVRDVEEYHWALGDFAGRLISLL